MNKDELTEEDVMKYLEECNESQDIHGFCYIPEIVCSKILDLYQKEKEKNRELQSYMKTNLIPKSTINLLYTSKDKIKDKIKEVEELDMGYEGKWIIDLLEELLEENNGK